MRTSVQARIEGCPLIVCRVIYGTDGASQCTCNKNGTKCKLMSIFQSMGIIMVPNGQWGCANAIKLSCMPQAAERGRLFDN